MMKRYSRILICIILLIGTIYFCSSYFGWYGYEKWKYRRSTRGQVEESINRKVFVRNLNYQILPASLSINFNAYIEKGYFYGFHSMEDTRVINKSPFPFQVSFSQIDTKNNIYFSLAEEATHKYDSIDRYCVYLENNHLDDTLYIYIIKNNIDSIGFIKVFDAPNGADLQSAP